MKGILVLLMFLMVICVHGNRTRNRTRNGSGHSRPHSGNARSGSGNARSGSGNARSGSGNARSGSSHARISGNPRPWHNRGDCILFRSNDTIALTQSISTYAEIGNINVRDDFSLYMEVFPSPLNHNGILLSVGSTPNFGYYEWKTKAIHVQFLVVEFIFSALALTVKALNTEHLQQIEIYRTYPTPYRIDEARWHVVKVIRTRTDWKVYLDDLFVKKELSNSTMVYLSNKPAFIGGRPNYTDHQFQGIMRNVKINGRNVVARNMSNNHVTKCRCDGEDVNAFEEWAKRCHDVAKAAEQDNE